MERGESAALLEQYVETAGDVFVTSIGNVPPRGSVVVEVTCLGGELQCDAQSGGVRFTVPVSVCPRYGNFPDADMGCSVGTGMVGKGHGDGAIKITVDVLVDEQSLIQRLHSPTNPLDVTLGRISSDAEDNYQPTRASATATLARADHHQLPYRRVMLADDFVLIVHAKGQDTPYALLERHPTLPNQRAIMASLVPKFNLPPNDPEIVFIIDRSGSMDDKIPTLKNALTVFLKSLPLGVKFNLCSFGSTFDFLWEKSRTYDRSSLHEALLLVDSIDANYGGTEMQGPIVATV